LSGSGESRCDRALHRAYVTSTGKPVRKTAGKPASEAQREGGADGSGPKGRPSAPHPAVEVRPLVEAYDGYSLIAAALTGTSIG